MALLMLYEPVKRLAGIHNIFQQAIGASQKVFEYLEHAAGDRREARRRETGALRALHHVRNVSFRYPGANGQRLRARTASTSR